MEFWNSLLTEKSWKIMQGLRKEGFRFIVIGGWAAYLWTKQHKSRGIDIIIPDFKSLEVLKKKYDLRKNDNLKKYEIKIDEIDVDIYIPYYSRTTLPIQELINETTNVEGFEVIKPEILLILKQGAEFDRKDSIKGQKDRIDIMTLLCYVEINFKKYKDILIKYKLEKYKQRLKEIINSFRDLKHLNLNIIDYIKIKKRLVRDLDW
ncbi:MAG: hypothetical protein AB1571_03740 [Nanoarchaeota archaeon]